MRFFFLVISSMVLLSGCNSRIPESIGYPYNQQRKMQASHHWQILAEDLANKINKQLIITDNIDKAVFVKETCGDESTPCDSHKTSSFNEAFRDLLITDLVDLGIPTRKNLSDDAVEILYKVQLVRHNTNRIRTLQPGILSSLSAAIVVLRNAPTELVLLATGVAADIANTNLTINNHYEIVITTSMVLNNQYLFRASDIYYINDKDLWQYQQTMPGATTIHLSSM